MNRTFAAMIILSVITTTALSAAQNNHGKLGVGVMLGAPTGLSSKIWLSPRGAVDATVGWDFVESDVVFHTGYLYHFPIDIPQGLFAPYIGAGAYVGYDFGTYEAEPDSFFLAARIPIGLEYAYKSLGFFAEINPIPYVYPAIGFSIGGGIGLRYYF